MAFFGVGNRKFQSGEDKVAKILENASIADVDLAEMQWTMTPVKGDYPRDIIGLDVPVIRENEDVLGNFSFDVRWIKDGTVTFYPDRRGIRYGYLALTDRNRKAMAHYMHLKWCVPVDGTIKRDTERMLDKMIRDGEIVIDNTPTGYDAHVKKDMTVELQKKLAELEKKIADKQAEEPVVEEKPKPTPPLAGKRIKKRKAK